jgi:hypothetical protein
LLAGGGKLREIVPCGLSQIDAAEKEFRGRFKTVKKYKNTED